MDSILPSFVIVLLSEMGDKTQLLALLLTVQFKRPGPILLGILIATLINHALAAGVGDLAVDYIPLEQQRWVLASLFVVFGIWALFPDATPKFSNAKKWSAFLTTLVCFFIAEMGDKTQLATLALAAKHQNTLWVTLGSTLGLMAANIPVVIWGEKVLKIIPLKWFRILSCVLFLGFAVYAILS